jgi:hypothetical protein
MRTAAAALNMAALRVNIGSFLHLDGLLYRRHFAPFAASVFALGQASGELAESSAIIRR